MPRAKSQSARLEARIAPEALDIVRRAAEIEGRSLSDLVVTAAREAAQRTIEQTHLIRLTMDEQRRFMDLLRNPPEPSPALRRAREAHARLIRESR